MSYIQQAQEDLAAELEARGLRADHGYGDHPGARPRGVELVAR